MILAGFVSLASTALGGDDYLFSIDAGVGLNTLNGGAPPWFGVRPQFQFRVEAPIRGDWRAELIYTRLTLYDDRTNHSEFSLTTDEDERTRAMKGYDVGVLFRRRFHIFGENLPLSCGLGVGLSDWRMANPQNNVTLITEGALGGNVAYSATEIFVASALGVFPRISRHWQMGLDLRVNYMTGAGREFESGIEDALGRWHLKAGLTLGYLFGVERPRPLVFETVRRSPGNTEPDLPAAKPSFAPAFPVISPNASPAINQPMTVALIPAPAMDSSFIDSDDDGVPDAYDNCPDTPPEAIGLIDIRGCSIDSDADGIPDYRDACPDNRQGALVNPDGCPRDSDGDGIPDGLDDCPGTASGLAVDKFGCVDVSSLKEKIILDINYADGSFEIDYKTRPLLDSLARILRQAPQVKIEINAYTDESGPYDANRILSQKRANRVRDYLVEQGIASDRMNPEGRGESNFVASNDTERGRQKNRRVELVFLR